MNSNEDVIRHVVERVKEAGWTVTERRVGLHRTFGAKREGTGVLVSGDDEIGCALELAEACGVKLDLSDPAPLLLSELRGLLDDAKKLTKRVQNPFEQSE